MSIEISGLTKQYGSQKAVDNISFSAAKGEILGFLGPNGAGKSTTMKIATCFLPPTSGSVAVAGIDVATSPRLVRQKVGYLPEHNPLYLDMYVHEYLRFIGSLHGLAGGRLKTSVAEAIERVGLEREQHKKVGALSKGYRQRVGLAQAILHQPEVLILDEPTTGLDPNQILQIRQLIKQESQNKTVVFSTHIMQEVQALCDRVVIINRGKIVADSRVSQLQMGSQQTTIFLELEQPVAEPESLTNLPEVATVVQTSPTQLKIESAAQEDIRGKIFRFAVANGWTIVGMSRETKSLEHVFHELTGNG